MSLRGSRKRFRPVIERCESRDLPAAGLASLMAPVSFAMEQHVPAQRQRGGPSPVAYDLVEITNPLRNEDVSFTMTITGTNFKPVVDSPTLNPKSSHFFWAWPSSAKPKFTVTFSAPRGVTASQDLKPKASYLDTAQKAKLAADPPDTGFLKPLAAHYEFFKVDTIGGISVKLVEK